MPVFVTSSSVASRPDVYAIERTPPATIQATGSSTAALVEQFPWGPPQVVFEPTDFKNLLDTVAPAGMSHLGSGYLALIKKGFPLIKVVRVLGSTAVKAFATILTAGAVSVATVTLKYAGTAGNSVTVTTSAASDGDATHFNLTVTATGVSGTTTDFIENLYYPAAGPVSAPVLTSCLLVGAIAKTTGGTAAYTTYTCASGTNGTVDATTYVGTAGTGNKGISLLEGDRAIDAVFAGDPGNSLRAAVNAGLVAHADLMTDRVAYINGDSGMTQAATVTDVASYRSARVVYCDPWVYITDDETGASQLVPPAPFAASVACQLSPSTDIGWKDDKVIAMLDGIVSLESDRGASAATATAAGIVTIGKEVNGGFTFELGVVTIAPTTPSKRLLTRTRMGHYIARSEVSSLRSKVNSPNVPFNQQDEVNAIELFLAGLKANLDRDPNNTPFIVDYQITDLHVANSAATIAAGEFWIPQDIMTGATQSKIFLSLNYGPTVTIKVTL